MVSYLEGGSGKKEATPKNEIDMLKQNVYDLEKQVHDAWKRIDELNRENDALKRQLFGDATEGC